MKKIFLLLALSAVAFGAKAADEPVYNSLGMTCEASSWGPTAIPDIDNIAVEAYEDYIILRGFYGVEGYDLMVTPNPESQKIESIVSIINGEESEPYTAESTENFSIPTGDETTPAFIITPYYFGYCYASSNSEFESGYVTLCGYMGAVSDENYTYYNVSWPQLPRWKELDLANATLQFTSNTQTYPFSSWGTTIFPEVKDIPVEIYDKYIILKSFAGVEGYDMLVAYDPEDENEYVTSIVSIVKGEWSEQTQSPWIATGREDYAWFTATALDGYTYAASDGANGGYVLLSGYLYSDDYCSAYYYVYWDEAGEASVSIIPADQVKGNAPMFNLKGQRVNEQYKGIVVKDGVKVLNK